MGETENRFIRELWGLQGAAYLVVGLRYFSRIHSEGWSKLAWDDALMFMATVCTLQPQSRSKRNLPNAPGIHLARVHSHECYGISRGRVLEGACQ